MCMGCNKDFSSCWDYNVHLKREKVCYLRVKYDQSDSGHLGGVPSNDNLETDRRNTVDRVELTEQPVDFDVSNGERESADSDGVEDESGTFSIHGNADWDTLSFISEASDDNDDGDSSGGAYYYPSSSSDHSEDYCNPGDNNGDIPQAPHLR